MSRAPFPIQPELTAIAIAYRNKKLIADGVLPRLPVGKQEFKYLKHILAEGFTIPNTLVGRKSQPNQVEFNATELSDFTVDYGLDDFIPQEDLDNAPVNFNPLGKAVESIQDLIALDREVRVANLVFNAANYPALNKKTLAGSSQFSDPSSDPIKEIMDALDTPVMRPNIMVIGRAAFSVLVRHPKIVKAVLGNAGDSGIAKREDIKALFELDDVLVGEGYVNTAKKGLAANLQRVWGKHAAFIYRDSVASVNRGTTFGFTAQFGDRVAGDIPAPEVGLRGSTRVRSGESVKEVISAPDLAFFLQNLAA